MRVLLLFLVLHLLYTVETFSQESDDTTVVLKKANELLYIDPIQTLKIGERLKRSATTNEEILQTNLLLAKGNFVVGNYTQSIVSIKDALKKVKESNNPEMQITTYLFAVELYNFLNLFEISKEHFNNAKKIAAGNTLLEKKLAIYEQFVIDHKSKPKINTRLVTTIASQNEINDALISKGTPLLMTALYFNESTHTDSASFYFKKSLQSVSNKYKDSYWEMIVLIHYSTFLFQQKEYANAEKLLIKSLKKAAFINNPYFLEQTYSELSNCYLALVNQPKFQEFKLKASQAKNEYETQKSMATNFAFEYIQKEAEEASILEKSRQNISTYILVSVIFLLILTWFFLRWLHNSRMNHLLDIINYLKLIHQPVLPPISIEKNATKNLSISKDTEDTLLVKLEKFEGGKKYLNKDISLAQMASLFETNTKYLSEVINKHKGKNVNLYINELRINYIVEKLKTDSKYMNYKVSYLAEECGFSSHSSFTSVFKNITGLTPNTFINFLNKDMNEINKLLEIS